jgi:hypothetical protein
MRLGRLTFMAQISVKVNGASKSIDADQRPTHLFSEDDKYCCLQNKW